MERASKSVPVIIRSQTHDTPNGTRLTKPMTLIKSGLGNVVIQ